MTPPPSARTVSATRYADWLPPVTLGQRIKTLRKEQGLSQTQLGSRAGMDTSSLSHFETGYGGREPSIGQLVRIAHGLGMTVIQLLDGVDLSEYER